MSGSIFNLNGVDFFIIGIILLSTLISLVRGFIREALSIATWIVAIWIGFLFSGQLAGYLVNYIKTPSLGIIAGFAIIVMVTLVIGALLSRLMSAFVVETGLSGTDRMIGMIFGFARGVLLVSVLILVGSLTVFVHDPWWKASALIPHFMVVVDWLRSILPDQVTKLFHVSNQTTLAS